MRPPALAPQGDTPLAGGEGCQDERRNVNAGTEESENKSWALPGIGQLDTHAPEIGSEVSDYPVMHFTDSTRTHTESGAVDESLCLKPARFASGDRNIHWADPSRCRPLRIAPGQTIRRAQIRDWMFKSDSGRMHRPHKTMPGYHSVAYPTENRRTKPFWNRPRPTLRTGSARFTDQIGNQMPDSEPVHGTPPDKDLRPVRHHRPHAPSRGIPTIPTGHHCLAQPGYSRRLARIENQPPISDSVQPLHRTQTGRQHHHQPETPEPSQSPYTTRPRGPQKQPAARTKSEIRREYPIQSINNTPPA